MAINEKSEKEVNGYGIYVDGYRDRNMNPTKGITVANEKLKVLKKKIK